MSTVSFQVNQVRYHKYIRVGLTSKKCVLCIMYIVLARLIQSSFQDTGNALARVQRMQEPADLWDITFCTL